MFKIILPKLNFKIETWKYNKEYRIYVSSLGHFKDEYKKNKPIKVASNGYCMIETPYGLKSVHRLVMLTFRPIPNAEDLTIDHLNHNKRCNELSNLEWVTKEENLERAKQDFIQLKEINSIKYKAGNSVFNNIELAIDWVEKTTGGLSNPSAPKRENIKKKINKAIVTKTLYCGRRWSCGKKI